MELAHIRYDGGGLVMPLQDPYDRELLVQHVSHQAHRNDRVDVRVGSRSWSVQRQPHVEARCQSCERPLGFVSWREPVRDQLLCASCALIGSARDTAANSAAA